MILEQGDCAPWMQKRLKKKLSGNGLRAGATVANIREGESTKRKTLHDSAVFVMLLENGSTETKHENSSR